MSEDLRYPLGTFDLNIEITPELRKDFIRIISTLPEILENACSNLNEEQLETPYRPGGWSVRQTVHHIADSHLNAYARFKLALTEDTPTIRPYAEDLWAELPDSKMPLDSSKNIIAGVHRRWTTLLESMTKEDFQKRLNHPETGTWTLEKMLALYSWHCRHHTAHITKLRERNNW